MTGTRGAVGVARGMLRGLFLRCPLCGKGRLVSGYMRLESDCVSCRAPLAMKAGDFGGAVMIAQFLVGLATLPTLFIAMLATDWPLDRVLYVVLAIVVSGLLMFYRNIKGLWFGFLVAEDARQQAAVRPADSS